MYTRFSDVSPRSHRTFVVNIANCPVELVRYVSAFEKAGETLGVGNKPSDLGRGTGADDESARRDFESYGEKDHLAGSGRDHRRVRPDDAADAGTLSGARLRRVIRSATP